MVIFNCAAVGKYRPTIGILIFCVSWGFYSDIPLPRLVIAPHPPDFVAEITPKIADFGRGGTCQRGAFLNSRPRLAIALVVIILRRPRC